MRRVLVVDDSATLRKVLKMHLEAGGYEVELAADGAEALEKVQRATFDLVLTDFVMPRLNGYQLAQAIRSIPALGGLPVVLVSARAEALAERFVAQTGAAGWISKPFSPAELLSVVGRALGELVYESDHGEHPGVRGGSSSLPSRDAAKTVRPGLVNLEREFFEAMGEAATGGSAGVTSRRTSTHEELGGDLSLTVDEATRLVSADHPALNERPAQASTVQARPTSPKQRNTAPSVAGLLVTQDAAHARFTEVLGRALLPVVRELSGGQPLDDSAVLRTLRYHFSVPAVAALARELRPLDAGLCGPVVLDGLVGAVPLGEVFQLLALQMQTGLLVIERTLRAGAPTITVALRHGRVELCVAQGLGPEFLLGRYLLADGVSRHDVDAALHAQRGTGQRLGEALVAARKLDPAGLERALVRQSSELVYELLRWAGGRFRFEADAVLPEAQAAHLGLGSDGLVLEGFRRIDEWRLIAEYIPNDTVVLVRDDSVALAAKAAELDQEEQRVLAVVDGTRAVRDVVEAVAMSAFDVYKILYGLLRARLLVSTWGEAPEEMQDQRAVPLVRQSRS